MLVSPVPHKKRPSLHHLHVVRSGWGSEYVVHPSVGEPLALRSLVSSQLVAFEGLAISLASLISIAAFYLDLDPLA